MNAQRSERAAMLRLVGAAMLLVPLFIRAMSLISPLPGWDIDPLIFPGPSGGVGPAESIALDCVVLLGAAMLAICTRGPALSAQSAVELRRRGMMLEVVVIVLLAIGGAAVVYHAYSGPYGRSLGNLRVGISWLSAMTGGVALWLARHDAGLRRVVAASLLGFVVVLAAKGAQQLLIEHPQTVASYRADPVRFLAGQGLSPESPMARAFERRLLQAEATGWMGLSNVYATLAAGMAVALCAFAVMAWRGRRVAGTAPVVITIGGAVVALGALGGANSKGGVLAAIVGFGALGTMLLAHRVWRARPRVIVLIGSALGVLAVMGPLALVVVRGVVGERSGELSLLFRWFYMQGAARIFAANPMGVGPDGFQQAYLLAKPPISPEEVTSPHSILLDWSADLGAAGLAWCVLLLLAAWMAGRVLAASLTPSAEVQATPAASSSDADATRAAVRFVLLVPALATLGAAWIERGAITPDSAIVRLLGLAGWCAASWAVLMVLSAVPGWPIAIAAGAMAILAHSQIDVAASWTQSCGIVMLLVSLAAASGPGAVGAGLATRGRFSISAITLAVLAVVAAAALHPFTAMQWQRHLLEARGAVSELGMLHSRLADIAASPRLDHGDSPEALATSISMALGRRVGGTAPRVDATPADIQRGLAEIEVLDLRAAAERLMLASAVHPDDWRVRREASRLHLRAAAAWEQVLGDNARAAGRLTNAVSAMQLPEALSAQADESPAGSPEWRWLAIVHLEQARFFEQVGERDQAAAARERGMASLERAATLDPWNLEIALRLMRTAGQAQEAAKARQWAARALELDGLMRLDAAGRGLTVEERAQAEAALRSP